MGTLSVPAAGVVYVDTPAVIYTVERHAAYEALLLPLWTALDGGEIEVVTRELTLLETLVKPLRDGDQSLARDYEKLLTSTGIRAQTITANVLREAARIRAAAGLKPRTQSTRPPPWQPAACCSSPTMRITVNSPHCRSLS